MSKIDLKHLQQFFTIISTGSFTKASENLGLTQPALTRNIKLMEGRLGLELLIRNKKGVLPSAFGKTILAEAQLVSEIEARILNAAQIYKDGFDGELRIGCTPSAAIYLLPIPLAEFATLYPKVRLDVCTSQTVLLENMLCDGKIDIFLGPPVENIYNKDIIFSKFFESPLVIVAGKNHPLSHIKSIKSALLNKQKWILFRPETSIRRYTEAYFRRLSVTTDKRVIELPSNMLITMLGLGEHLAVIPRFLFRNDKLADSLVKLDIKITDTYHPYGAVYRSDIPKTPLITTFIDFIEQKLRKPDL